MRIDQRHLPLRTQCGLTLAVALACLCASTRAESMFEGTRLAPTPVWGAPIVVPAIPNSVPPTVLWDDTLEPLPTWQAWQNAPAQAPAANDSIDDELIAELFRLPPPAAPIEAFPEDIEDEVDLVTACESCGVAKWICHCRSRPTRRRFGQLGDGVRSRQSRRWNRRARRELGGWASWGLYNNSHGLSGGVGNAPLGFNNLASELQLHQAWLYAAREVRQGHGLDWGYRADIMFGTDGPNTQAFGDGSWDAGWDTGGEYGFAMPQLFMEFAVNKLKVTVGHFFTITGYEVVQAIDNFLYSHTYTMVYNEPFTHTGVLCEYPITDRMTMYGGWTAGWDTGFSNGNNGSMYLGGLGWEVTDHASVIYTTSVGDPGDDPTQSSATYMHSLVFDMVLSDKWEWVVHSDFQNRRSDVLGGKSYGVVNYLFWKITQRMTLGSRYEWFRDSRGTAAVGGASQHFHAVTFGLNRTVGKRIVVRPELRYDWVDSDAAGGPFDLGMRQSQATFGMSGFAVF